MGRAFLYCCAVEERLDKVVRGISSLKSNTGIFLGHTKNLSGGLVRWLSG